MSTFSFARWNSLGWAALHCVQSVFFPAGTRYPEYLPVDLAASQKQQQKVYAVQEAMTFLSDQPPAGFGPVRLEQNDVAVILRSDSLDKIIEEFLLHNGPGGCTTAPIRAPDASQKEPICYNIVD